jgi:hypothetical protein
MEVIRNEHEFIESECSALAISIERFNKQFRGPLRTKNGPALRRHGRHEECAISELIHITAAESRILWSTNSQRWKPCASTAAQTDDFLSGLTVLSVIYIRGLVQKICGIPERSNELYGSQGHQKLHTASVSNQLGTGIQKCFDFDGSFETESPRLQGKRLRASD